MTLLGTRCGSDAIPLDRLEVNSNICRDPGNALPESGPRFEWLEALLGNIRSSDQEFCTGILPVCRLAALWSRFGKYFP